MIKNYFKTAWRNLMKNKVFSFINIFGLTIGLISFLLIALYIFDELTFDAFHKNADNIYRVVEHKITPEGKEIRSAGAGYQVSEKSKANFPEIKDVPVNSHLSFNLLFSESSVTSGNFKKFINSDWSSGTFRTYLLLNGKVNAHNVEAKINRLVAANKSNDTKDKNSYVLQPLKD